MWDLDSAVHEISAGDPRTEQFESAFDWLMGRIGSMASGRRPLMLGLVAETILDEFRKHREEE